MPILLIGYGANRNKFPVTAFDNMEIARDVINGLDSPIEVTEDGSIEGPTNLTEAHEVAGSLWQTQYFMADPPLRYDLIETNNNIQILSVSDD